MSQQLTDIPRSINLTPQEWRWAAWRNLPPLPRPEPRPFEKDAALQLLNEIAQANRSWYYAWHWDGIGLDNRVTVEEACFWVVATRAVEELKNLEKVVARMSEWTFNEGLTGPRLLEFIKADPLHLIHVVSRAVCSLFTPPEFVNFALQVEAEHNSRTTPHKWHNSPVPHFCDAFRVHWVGYLNTEEKASVRAIVRPLLDITQWPQHIYTVPPFAFFLAAMVGLSDELLPLVESWADDQFNKPDWSDYQQRPQEIVFGLNDPRLVEQQFRRLKLRFTKPAYVTAWLAHTEYAALDGVRESIQNEANKESAAERFERLCAVDAPEMAPQVLELMLHSKISRQAREWLEEHPTSTIVGLLPVAAGRSKSATAAQDMLLRLQRRGHAELLASALAQDKHAKLREIFAQRTENRFPPFTDDDTPDWLQSALPAKTAKLPDWLVAEDLPPLIVGERSLNPAQVHHLLNALQKSTPAQPHALVKALQPEWDKTAADNFAWKLFESWLVEGAPAKERWAFTTLAALGGDGCVLQLTPLLREWPGQSQHQRAVTGLEILRTIGTDTALMHINGIAQKLKFKGLKEKAKQCMEGIARDRNLTRAQLEDRIVPTCDLDERGTRIFTYGPRQFRVALSPELKPMVRDSDGKLKDNLPKPNSKDDATLAAQAQAEWKLLKKQLALVAKTQAERLEQAMVAGRRWTVDEFSLLLVNHPLMSNLTRLLVWGGYDATGQLVQTFRVSEDRTFADINDEDCDLAGVKYVQIVHPAHLSAEQLGQWGEILGDYEIVPPFPQLGRRIFRLAPDEADATEIKRFVGIKLNTKVLVFGLDNLNWMRGIPQDGGCFDEFAKQFEAAHVTAIVQFPGVPIGYYDDWEDQDIETCYFLSGLQQPSGYRKPEGALRLKQIDRVVISEVLKDLSALAYKGKR